MSEDHLSKASIQQRVVWYEDILIKVSKVISKRLLKEEPRQMKLLKLKGYFGGKTRMKKWLVQGKNLNEQLQLMTKSSLKIILFHILCFGIYKEALCLSLVQEAKSTLWQQKDRKYFSTLIWKSKSMPFIYFKVCYAERVRKVKKVHFNVLTE